MIIIAIDHVWCGCNFDTEEELEAVRVTCGYQVEGSEFSPMMKNGFWDGFKSLFRKSPRKLAGKFPAGLLSHVVLSLQDSHAIQLIDKRVYHAPQGGLDVTFGLRDYQAEAVEVMLEKRKGIVKLPTAAGKTKTAVALIARLNMPTLWLTHEGALARQSQEAIQSGIDDELEVGMYGSGKKNIQFITVAMVQTLSKQYKKLQPWLNQIQVLITDECFPGSTKVLTPYGWKRIKEVFENPHIEWVLSYDATKGWVSQRILRKIRKEYAEDFILLKAQDESGNIFSFCCTPNHKVWTTEGYIEAQHLTKEHTLKVYDGPEQWQRWLCNKCGFFTDVKGSLGPHLRHNCKPRPFKKRKQGRNNPEARYRSSQAKLGSKNVMKRKEVREKVSKTAKERFQNLPEEVKDAQIRRFKQAPRYNRAPNKPEQCIIDLELPSLKYTGDGRSEIFHFENGKRKFPDFCVEGQKKVVEVCDFEFWHTKEEMDQVCKQYEKIGVKCLILDAKDVISSTEMILEKLFTFITNHSAKLIQEPTRQRSAFRPSEKTYVYDLEVEDAHNYIANGILVSNCHHGSSASWHKAIMNIPASYRFGISATPFDRGDQRWQELVGGLGPLIYEKQAEEVSEHLSRPNVHLYHTPHRPKVISGDWSTRYEAGIVNHEYRNRIITELGVESVRERQPTIIFVSRLHHGRELRDRIEQAVGVGGLHEFIHGHTPQEARDKAYNDLRTGSKYVIIATDGVAGEGQDIPAIRRVIIGGGYKATILVKQRIGRGMRPDGATSGEDWGGVVQIYDFVDEHDNGLYEHSQERIAHYEQVGSTFEIHPSPPI